jgi:hypothetical protein
MSCQPAYTNSQGCVVTPACAGSAYQPGYTVNQPIFDWNAGADSITELTGDAHTVFQMPTPVSGVIIGFKTSRLSTTVPSLITHGFYFFNSVGTPYAQIVESGQVIGSAFSYTSADNFEVRRASGQVTYWHNSALIYTSSALSIDAIIVNTCLFASGDQAPSLGGAALAASFSVSGATTSTPVFTDTSTGTNIAWRAWTFTTYPNSAYWIYDPSTVGGNVPTPFQGIWNGSSTPIACPLATMYTRFSPASTNNTVMLTITDTDGNTSSASQTFTTLG